MKERTDNMLCTEVFGLCFNQSRTITDMTHKIYNNEYEKNIVRVFRCCESMMKNNILVPKFINGLLLFQVNQDSLKNKEG